MSALDEARLMRRREREAVRQDAEELDRLLHAEYWREEHLSAEPEDADLRNGDAERDCGR